MNVQIFLRPIQRPISTVSDDNIRISYGEWWVDFKNGSVSVTKDGAQEHLNTVEPISVASCPKCSKIIPKITCNHCGSDWPTD